MKGEVEHQPEACHCDDCRKQTGHFFAAVNVRRDALTTTGDEHITWYQSHDKVKRGFCSICGSTLFWQPTMDGYEYTAVAMGLFDGSTNMRLSKHTFVGDKGDFTTSSTVSRKVTAIDPGIDRKSSNELGS